MVQIKYVSKGGTVVMGGSSNIQLIKLSGFGLPSRRYDEITFVKENGVTTTGDSDYPRTLTITADIYGGQDEVRRVMEAFYHNGDMYCDFGPQMKRKISCKLIYSEDIENHSGSGINTFTLQFQADYPYFNDFEDTVISLASYKNHVTTEFTLPCVFTEAFKQGSMYNYGNKRCYGVISLYSAFAPTDAAGNITISNLTTGKRLNIEHLLEKDETVVIDLNTRKITSNLNGNLTNAITDDTEMADFYFELGKNDLEFTTSETTRPVSAGIRYNNVYLMAVV